MGNIKDYIRIARIDHWIKQLFIFPGMVFAFFLVDGVSVKERLIKIILAFRFFHSYFPRSFFYSREERIL